MHLSRKRGEEKEEGAIKNLPRRDSSEVSSGSKLSILCLLVAKRLKEAAVDRPEKNLASECDLKFPLLLFSCPLLRRCGFFPLQLDGMALWHYKAVDGSGITTETERKFDILSVKIFPSEKVENNDF